MHLPLYHSIQIDSYYDSISKTIDYGIHFPDVVFPGYVVGWYKLSSKIPCNRASNLSLNSLRTNDVVLHIGYFFPLGDTINPHIEQRKKQGVASRLLQKIEEDARNRGAKGIYVYSVSDSFRAFAKKKGFEQDYFLKDHYKPL